MPIQCLTHIGLCVSDLERSRRFYRDLLGFEERTAFEIAGEPTARLMELPDFKLQCIYLERDGVRLELMYFPNHPPEAGGNDALRPIHHVGLTHFAFRVTDFDATLARLEQAGVRALHHTRIRDERFQSHVMWLTDPDGVRIEIAELPGDPRALLGEPIS